MLTSDSSEDRADALWAVSSPNQRAMKSSTTTIELRVLVRPPGTPRKTECCELPPRTIYSGNLRTGRGRWLTSRDPSECRADRSGTATRRLEKPNDRSALRFLSGDLSPGPRTRSSLKSSNGTLCGFLRTSDLRTGATPRRHALLKPCMKGFELGSLVDATHGRPSCKETPGTAASPRSSTQE